MRLPLAKNVKISVCIKIVRLIRNVGDGACAMSAHTHRLAAGRGTDIGLQHISLQHVNDDQSAPRWV